MFSLRPFLAKLLESLPPPPAGQDELKEIVSATLADAKPHASTENWKNQWEYLLKDEIFKLAVRPNVYSKACERLMSERTCR